MEHLLYLLSKVRLIFKELFYLIKKHSLYFLAPVFIIIALLAFFVYYVGPAIIVSFIYAGI
jgi:predicted membrane protein